MTDLRLSSRRVALAAYRRLGSLGFRIMGPDPRDVNPNPDVPPWTPLPETPARLCVVCRWQGAAFEQPGHVELTICPQCGSNGRDRFLFWCLRERVELSPALRVIECSPRMGRGYRDAMSSWFFYRTTDFDQRAHRGNLRLDLQAIDLPDACVDVLLCAHVLEHVPDTDRALDELRRILVPGGHLLLQVPVLQGHTAPPTEPEFHDDRTPVFWRFGPDLTDRLRERGFQADLLCTRAFADAVKADISVWPDWSPEFDVPGILAGTRAEDLVVVADAVQASQFGLEPGYMYVTWDCVAPD